VATLTERQTKSLTRPQLCMINLWADRGHKWQCQDSQWELWYACSKPTCSHYVYQLLKKTIDKCIWSSNSNFTTFEYRPFLDYLQLVFVK